MSDSGSDASSNDGDGDVKMAGIERTYSYKVTFDLYYEHTYEREDPDEQAVAAAAASADDSDAESEDGYYEGQAVPCKDPACQCDGEEAPLTAEEMDDFMREPYCSDKPRYYWYCVSVLEHMIIVYNMKCSVRDVTYADGGKLSCILDITRDNRKKRHSIGRLKHLIDELDLYNSIYAGGPGNEAIIPTAHEYRYIVMSTFTYDQTQQERGRIAFKGHYNIEVI